MPEKPQEEPAPGVSKSAGQPSRPRQRLRRLAAGLLSLAAVAVLVPFGFEVRTLPAYEAGEQAERTVRAIQTFTVEDREATALKREAAARRAAAVFDLDLRVNDRLEAELRHIFASGRAWIEQERQKSKLQPQQQLSPALRNALQQRLRTAFPGMSPPAALEELIQYSFPARLEDQSVALLRSSLSPPGVVAARDLLSRYQDRGITVRNIVTGRREPLQDWSRIRDLEQARESLLQNRSALQLDAKGQEALAELVSSRLAPNLAFNESETRLSEEQARLNVDPVLIQVQAGRAVIEAGKEVMPQDIVLLQALRERAAGERLLGRLAGLASLSAFFLLALLLFLPRIGTDLKPGVDYFVISCALLMGSLAVVKATWLLADLAAAATAIPALQDASLLAAAAPFALGAALMALLGSTPLALLWSVVFSLLAALISGDLRALVYALAGCVSAIYLLRNCRQRRSIVPAGLGVGLAQAVALAALHLYSPQPVRVDFLLWGLALSLCSGLAAIALAWLALPLLERVFGITTNVRLLELANLNSPLLRRLAVEAPGTFHHSMLVASLAETAARSISANPLLARAGAYYHDIGKLGQPGAYTENQIFEEKGQHRQSSRQTIQLQSEIVRQGLEMAQEGGLPAELQDLIRQHLGSVAEAADCRGPAAKPASKEAAILLLANQAEPSARALQRPSADQIRGLVRRLVQAAVQEGQLDECPITVRDLDRISQAFEKVLAEIHQRRVEYPGLEFNHTTEAVPVASSRLQ